MEQPAISSTCTVEYKGNIWPVVVCGKQHLCEDFMRTRPQNGHFIPCILLGIHKYIWVKATRLRDYDPTGIYLREDSPFGSVTSQSTDLDVVKLREQHRQAVKDEAPQLFTADFWWNYIKNGSEARKLERDMAIESHQKSKSRGSRKHGNSSGSDEVRIVGVKPRSQAQPAGNHCRRPNHRHGRQSGEQIRSNGKALAKISKGGNHGHGLSTTQKQAIRNYSSRQSSQGRNHASKQSQSTMPPPAGPDDCYVIVGEEEVPFTLKKTTISKIETLASQVRHTRELGALVNLSKTLPNLTTAAFNPVYNWLINGDFHPRLTVREYGDNVEWEIARAGPSGVETIALAFFGASVLEIAELQDLCYRKLRALYPVPAQALVKVAACISDGKKWGWEGENEIDKWLTSHMQDFFWALMEDDGRAFGAFLRHNDEVRKVLFLKMAESPETGDGGQEVSM